MKNNINDYDKFAEKRQQDLINGMKPSHRFVEKPMMKSMLPDLKNKKILMLGCGTGEESKLLETFGASSKQLIGIDLSNKSIEIAKNTYPDIEFVVGDMNNLPFENECFDFVYSSLAIHYNATPEKTYKEVYRVLKPDGLFLFSVGHPLRWSSEEKNIENSGTITSEEVEENANVINNIPVISKDAVSKTLENSQTVTGHYVYPNISIAKYNINGKNQLVYVAPREITNSGRTYNNKTYEYTHGIGEIFTSATESSQNGNIQYIQKDIVGKDEKINISEPRIYFGLETKETIATNTKNKNEYDYTDENGTDQVYSYNGQAGLQLGFLDRLILGIKKGDINLAFSGEITNESKILINRDVITRAKKALPYLIYDEEPYTAVTDEGKIVWVLDAYTVSSSYPYSQYTSIEHDGTKEKINYIRNSVKVIIDSYDGTMSYYITDRNDPIIMAYQKMYKDLFVDKDETIPEDISKQFIYPEYLYKIQAEIMKRYHNIQTDVLYRGDDIWKIATRNTTKLLNKSGIEIDPYYTIVKTVDNENTTLGLVLPYTPYNKQNLTSYLVGSYENGQAKLSLYRYPSDSNVLGTIQLDTQIEQDKTISKELETLNITGTKIIRDMVIVPINNTLLYVEPIYQQYMNEENSTPILKKVIVASGNKVAIGNDITEALKNLVSQSAVDIEVEDTETIEGLIQAIVKANNNLKQSNSNNNWEMAGKDMTRLQALITKLEKLQKQNQKVQSSNLVENLTNQENNE